MNIKLAVFDVAGTTVEDNGAVTTAFKRAFNAYGITVSDEEINPVLGYRKPIAIKALLDKLGKTSDEDRVEDIHREFETEMIEYYEHSPEVRPATGAENIFLKLKERGIRIALNTGFSKIIIDKIMIRMQWKEKGLVDDYIASDEVKQGRPYAYMIEALMNRAGIEDPKEVIKIGDTEVDINEGRNAGCGLVVAVTTGALEREKLKSFAPDFIIDSLNELPEIISRL